MDFAFSWPRDLVVACSDRSTRTRICALYLPPDGSPSFHDDNSVNQSPGAETQPAFSSDGKQVAFIWDGNSSNKTDVYIKAHWH